MPILEIYFPRKGKNEFLPASAQSLETTADCNNVRLFDVLANRARGGQRPGLKKWGNGDLIGGSEQPVVAMVVVSSVS